MQNPLAPLDKDRLLFPGQRYTSLGMSKEIGGMIYDLATESRKDLLLWSTDIS